MDDVAPFLIAIEADPTDDWGWLIFADWLEERGDPLALEIRRIVERGDWNHFRKALLPSLAEARAQCVAWECLERILPFYEAQYPEDVAPRRFIEMMIRPESTDQVDAALATVKESELLRFHEFRGNAALFEFAWDFIQSVQFRRQNVESNGDSCASLMARSVLGPEFRRLSSSDPSRWRSLRNAEFRWQIARILRHRFDQGTSPLAGRPLIRIASLEIDPAALEFLPESLARSECVLPLGLEGNAIRVAFGRRDVYQELIDKLRFITNRRLFWAIANRRRLEEVIDEVYTYRETEVTNCPVGPRFQCPRRWLEFQPGQSPDVRFCESCNRKVYRCANQSEAEEYAGLARRVAVYKAPEVWQHVDC